MTEEGTSKPNAASPRLHLLDSLRGLTLLSMIAYHTMWDLVYLFDVQAPRYRSFTAELWQQSICWTFILLSGFCHGLGRHPVRRGLLVTGASVLVSAVTLLFMPSSRILFGVLTLIGLSMLLAVPVGKVTQKLPVWPLFLLSFALFILTKTAQERTLIVFGQTLCTLPDALYRSNLTALLGFPQKGFFSTDYFPLIPWFFLYLTGMFLYRIVSRAENWKSRFKQPRLPVLAWLGRHSLPVYMLHQPVIYAVLTVLFEIL